MEELVALLGREHVQLEFLLFKLLQLQHLLNSGDPRFLRWSGEEIRRASQRVQETALARGEMVHAIARENGLPDRMTLDELAGSAPEPWRTICFDHAQSYLRLQHEVERTIHECQQLADAAGHVVADVLSTLPHPVPPHLLPRQISLDDPLVLP